MDSLPLDPDALPDGWTNTTLGKAVDFTRKPRGLVVDQQPAVTFLPMELLPDNSLETAEVETREPSVVTSGVYFEEGDILLAKITPCLQNGKQAVARNIPNGWGIATTEVYAFKPKQHSTDFLALLLRQPGVLHWLASKLQGATGRQRLPREALESLAIPVPPLPEQRVIAHVLRAVQRAKEAAEAVASAARQLKRSLLRHLFTYGPVPVDHADRVPLKETDIGPIPEHWEVTTVGAVIATGPQNGLYKPKTDYGTGTPIVRIDDFDNTGSIIEAVPNVLRLTEGEVSTYRLAADELVVNRVNSLSHLGKTGLVGELPLPTVFESNMMRFGVDAQRARPRYVFHFLNFPACRDVMRSKAKRAVAQSSINQEDVKSLPLPLPPPTTQDEMVSMISAAETKIRVEESRVSALGDVFRSLLGDLMTGRVRVHDLDLPIPAEAGR